MRALRSGRAICIALYLSVLASIAPYVLCNVSRLGLLETTVSGAATNAMTLLLTDEAPLSSLRGALRDMTDCVARSLDEDVPTCVPGPAHWVAAHMLVLTDLRTWVSPPDADNEQAVLFGVMKRRLAPRVRTDQCGEKERP